MFKTRRSTAALLAIVAAVVALDGCSPAPRRTLGGEDKLADMYWLYSQFNENYAPLEYKEGRFGFKYEELKQRYLAEANRTQNNDEFYKVMYRFVSEFKDAHTAGSLNNSQLPNRAKVGYLGFSGKRQGDVLLVTELLPTIKTDSSNYPLKVGDKITKLGGQTLKEVVKAEMVQYRDLGLDEANYTYHFNKIFNRVNTANGLPSGETAVLTVLREGKESQVALPWIVKDLGVFKKEQAAATKKSDSNPVENAFGQIFQIGFLRYDGKIEPTATYLAKLLRWLPEFKWTQTFAFVDHYPTWATKLLENPDAAAEAKPVTGFELLGKDRDVPPTAIPIPEAKTFPAYVTREEVLNGKGEKTGATKFVGYLYLNTFSPGGGEKQVLDEVQATLVRMVRDFQTTDLVIDMINNGGGSLTLGMKLAQLLSGEKVTQPDIQFRISETWLDNFEQESLNSASDTEAEFAAKAFKALTEDKAAGRRLSRRFSTEALEPMAFKPNDKLEKKLNIVLLVNEMCASMCDIFTQTMKDNKLVTIVGQKTMGAGGNVVDHPQAPNSGFSVRQTESLIVKGDGGYVENNGVDPDFALSVSESVLEKYTPVRKKAIELLVTQK